MTETTRHAAEIDRDSLRAGLAASSFVLVDVLPAESYETGHIPGAISLPLASIPSHAATLLPDRAAPVVVYCGGFT